VPDTVTSVGRMVQIPPLPQIPEPLRGRSFVVVEVAYMGGEEDGAALVLPLRELAPAMDTVATMPAKALSRLHQDPENPSPIEQRLDAVFDRLAPWEAGRYLNFTEGKRGNVSFYPEQTERRLRRIRTKYDPQDLFRANHPILH
jgi:hypothetical protein